MENKLPKITIVTVCFNAVKSIEETMLSVLNQTYLNIEYIIIDGGSMDGTVDIIKKYADRLAYWVSEPDKGIYDAMNKGITVATGDYINFMNAGDTFTSANSVSKIIQYHEDEKILYGNIIKCFKRYKKRDSGINSCNPKVIDFIGNTIHHQAAFIQRNLFSEYGLYSIEYKLVSDWKFFLEVVAIGKERIKYVNLDVAYFKMDGATVNNAGLCHAELIKCLNVRYGEEICSYLWLLKEYRSNLISNKTIKLLKYCRNKEIIHKTFRLIKNAGILTAGVLAQAFKRIRTQ